MYHSFINFIVDKEKDIITATERLQAKLNDSYKKQEELSNDISNLKVDF